MARERKGSLYKKTRLVNSRRIRSTCWYGSFTDPHTRKRVTKKLYSDKQASRRELDQMIEESERKATGIIDRYAEHRIRPIENHVADYFAHCEHKEQAKRHRQVKERDINHLIKGIGAKRLTDIEPNAVERYLKGLRDEGLSARKINAVRAHVIAFLAWCVRTGRCPENPLAIVPKLDERKDRRRVRRALLEDELERLLNATANRPEMEMLLIRRGKDKGKLNAKVSPESLARARETGRERRMIYLTAALTGLRRNELTKITWADVDLEASTLRVRIGVGKAKREDFVPLHPQLRDELASFKRSCAKVTDRVFSALPSCRTFDLDLQWARAEWINEAKDDPQERECREKSCFLSKFDEQGRVVDLHALRTTLGTNLARAGVSPQLAQRIMRHSDYNTTMGHYTVLGLSDTVQAIAELPGIGQQQHAQNTTYVAGATGTEDASPAYASDVVAPVVAPVVANEVHSKASRGTLSQFGRHEQATRRRCEDKAQVPDLSTPNTPRHRVSQGVRAKRATGLEPATFSLEG